MNPGDALIEALTERIATEVATRIAAKLQAAAHEPIAYSIAQTAVRLGLSESTIKDMVRDHEIAVVRRGTRVLIPRKSIDEWIERELT